MKNKIIGLLSVCTLFMLSLVGYDSHAATIEKSPPGNVTVAYIQTDMVATTDYAFEVMQISYEKQGDNFASVGILPSPYFMERWSHPKPTNIVFHNAPRIYDLSHIRTAGYINKTC